MLACRLAIGYLGAESSALNTPLSATQQGDRFLLVHVIVLYQLDRLGNVRLFRKFFEQNATKGKRNSSTGAMKRLYRKQVT